MGRIKYADADLFVWPILQGLPYNPLTRIWPVHVWTGAAEPEKIYPCALDDVDASPIRQDFRIGRPPNPSQVWAWHNLPFRVANLDGPIFPSRHIVTFPADFSRAYGVSRHYVVTQVGETAEWHNYSEAPRLVYLGATQFGYGPTDPPFWLAYVDEFTDPGWTRAFWTRPLTAFTDAPAGTYESISPPLTEDRGPGGWGDLTVEEGG